MSDYRWVGKPARRIDGDAKVRGTLAFPSDVSAPDMLHCRPVLAPCPHATLLGIRSEAALQVPGVVRVLTSKDVPGSNRYGSRQDHPVLCDDKLRYTGDMVAVVVAESEQAAEIGAARVEVLFEPLPLVTDLEKALADRSVRVHDSGNILHQIHYDIGNVDAVFARTDVVSVEQVYRPQFVDHAFLETEAGVAFPEGLGVRVVSCGQNAYYDQEHVARALGLPLEQVRMVEPFSGGAFGGKGDITVQIVIAVAALLTQRPCRMVWTRSEHFRAGVKRHACNIRIRTAASTDGDLLALEARILADTGAYAVFGEGVLELMSEAITGPYRVPNVRVDAWSVYTNNVVSGAFRGFGATQGCLAIEAQMSELAQRLGMDEIEFRWRNALSQGDRAGPGHLLILPMAVKPALRLASQHPLWQQRGRLAAPIGAGSIRRGIGMAISMKGFSLGCNDAGDYSAADMCLQEGGRFLVKTGIIELGQGSYTALAMLAAEALGCGLEMVDFQAGDTGDCPEAGTTASSRVTYAVGRAVIAAAYELVSQIRAAAAAVWQVPVDQVELGDGVVWDRQNENQLALSELVRLVPGPLEVSHRQRIPYSERKIGGGVGHPHVLYSSNTQIVQVAVDTETGEITVEQVVTFPEVGQVVNRLGLEGQCEGGIIQGIGYALMEQVVVDKGLILNGDLTKYPVPTVADICPIETIPIELPEETGPFGAKGAAENATLPTAPAILDAIADAIGIRFTTLPVTPERVLEALAGEARS
jgi:CO/xanthine dehydrogenase Mo-binding subunit